MRNPAERRACRRLMPQWRHAVVWVDSRKSILYATSIGRLNIVPVVGFEKEFQPLVLPSILNSCISQHRSLSTPLRTSLVFRSQWDFGILLDLPRTVAWRTSSDAVRRNSSTAEFPCSRPWGTLLPRHSFVCNKRRLFF